MTPSRQEEAEPNNIDNAFSLHFLSELQNQRLQHPYYIQRFLSFFLFDAPALPVTNAPGIRISHINEDIPQGYLRGPSQRSLQRKTALRNRQNRHFNRFPNTQRPEEHGINTPPDFIVEDSREVSHNARKNALAAALKPMVGDKTDIFVLLCFGEEYKCSIIPVSVSDRYDETVIWSEIRQAWNTCRGWRRFFSAFGVKVVDLVDISIAGMNRRNPSCSGGAAEFVGMYTKKDLQIEKKRLESVIEGYEEQEYPCPYNPCTGLVNCFDNCVSYDEDVKCPEKVKFDAERQLENLETRHLMKHAFSHPELAHLNDYLQGEKVIYGHRDILALTNEWNCTKLREMKFRGILVEEYWKVGWQYYLLPLALSLSVSTVIVAKLAFGEWGTAWTVGCFFLPLCLFGVGHINTI